MTPHFSAKNIHLMDPKRARASVYRFWTACGEARSTRVVTTNVDQVTCKNCLNSKILRQAKGK